ncbi:GDSL-type esterase/lipase family protein [Chitinophaga sp. Cy-1792]|uniref:GDSL-type esterase/lipase family protein n=1 Tax=Chitinophaga sp. Cy-1792 TaxID=2608339 RepID=UPI001423299F|nr:GDSL-type esterase/lipase family protein [Chitinophaga sp. Cy-1792]NIG55537.1 GDSL family lipase [Chitinophaga sp. Cy-1792]
MKKLLLVFLAVAGLSKVTTAQEAKPRFWDDVQTIKAYDKIYAPPADPILFIGSSSIRKWGNVQQIFAPQTAMNRGIGGAIVNDITFYLNDIVFPYHPKEIVLYVGENDVPDAANTADTIFNRTKVLVNAIREKLPTVPLVYISMKPSPSRVKWIEKTKAANALIRNWIEKQPHCTYVDIFPAMLDAKGNTRPELFIGDLLHMNDKGYAIWNAAVKPYIVK